MSLIIDMLKKINKDKGKINESYSIPPSLKESKEKKKTLLPYLIGFFIIITSAALGFLYYLNTLTPENVVYKPVAKKTDSGTEKNTEQIKTVNTSENLKNKEEKIQKTQNQENSNIIEKPPPIKYEDKNKVSENKSLNKANSITANNLNQNPNVFTDSDYLRLLNEANFYLKQNDYKNAIKVYEEILKYKDDKDVLNNLLVLYIRTGQENNIYKYLSKINENILLNITIELLKFNKIKEVKKLLDRAGKLEINNYLPYAIFYEKIGNFEKAFEFYKRAYMSNPENPLYAYYYGRALEIKGDYKDALLLYKNIYNKIENENMKSILKKRIEILSQYNRE